MKYDSIIVIGPPYSGKGTQCSLLKELPDFFHFSSGDMFRNLDSSTNIGKKVKALIDNGNFVDDKTLIELATETLGNYVKEEEYFPKEQFLLLDGLPRNISQIPFIESIANIKQVIYLDGGNKDTLIYRAQKRSKIEGRVDDSDLIKIEKRILKYENDTKPVIPMYYKIIERVNGLESIENVNKNILEIILRK